MDDLDESSPSPSAKPSKTPSWVMLGFFLGVLFMWLLPRSPAPAPPTPVESRAEPKILAAPRLTEVEAVFAEWGQYAIWENDLAEVALWNSDAQAYVDCFEVLRTDKGYYFRSISRLTRPVLHRGVKSNSPLLFTEPESHRQEWLKQVADENARTLSNVTRQIFGPGPKPTPGALPTDVPPPPKVGSPVAPKKEGN